MHCVLGPFWCERLGTDELHAHQASTRGGVLDVRVVGDRAQLIGHAVTTLRGDLLI
jgi:hypothetical protein